MIVSCLLMNYSLFDWRNAMKLLITGGCGFLGSNLAENAIKDGYKVTIFDDLSRIGSESNLGWLRKQGDFEYIHGDIRNKNDVENLIKKGFDSVFHLAGQVAMTTSIDDPYKDFEINVVGTLNLLDSVRKFSTDTSVFYSSTNKVYGDLEQYNYEEAEKRYSCREFSDGFTEEVPLDFRSPYGCSKGSADQYILDYHRIFGLKTTVFRHSSMYGSRQFATYDQGWIGWFCQKAIEKYNNEGVEKFTISGNGKQVRDILHVDDLKSLYFSALNNVETVCGNAYNIGGTIEQSLSLLELFDMLNELLNIRLEYIEIPVRTSDQKVFVANIEKINKKIDWRPKVNTKSGIENMLKWVQR